MCFCEISARALCSGMFLGNVCTSTSMQAENKVREQYVKIFIKLAATL